MLTIIIIKKSIYLIILFVLGFIAVVPAVAEMRLQFSLEILHMQFNKYQINIFKYPTSKLQQQCRAVVVFVKVLKSKTAVVLQIICTFAALCWFYNATAAEPKTGLTVTFKKKTHHYINHWSDLVEFAEALVNLSRGPGVCFSSIFSLCSLLPSALLRQAAILQTDLPFICSRVCFRTLQSSVEAAEATSEACERCSATAC